MRNRLLLMLTVLLLPLALAAGCNDDDGGSGTVPLCGNGVVDEGEQCDGTALGDATGCEGLGYYGGILTCGTDCRYDTSQCEAMGRCGDGIVQEGAGEQCDLLNLGGHSCTEYGYSGVTLTCGTDCRLDFGSCEGTLPTCGNGVLDPGEECDEGSDNSNVPNASCRPDCKERRCGDGVLDGLFGEVCDDGNTQSGDGCSADCKSTEFCGNGIVDDGEECDEGSDNSTAPNASCRPNCRRPSCGDGVIDDQLGEVCDAGANNSNDPNAPCRTDCKLPRCGDGITDTDLGETCDDGTANSDDPNAACRTNCKLRGCGDGILDDQYGEQCDAGANNSNDPNASCRTNCTLPSCGDGIPDYQLGEECDDGTANSNDPNAVCRTNCRFAHCGDGITDDWIGEECDDGTANSNDPNAACRTNCHLPRCGDGVLDDQLGEECDEGVNNSNNPNASCRTNCHLPRCGDGVTDTDLGEVCDDGNTQSGDGCSADCKSTEICGNGIVDTNEECDEGANNSNDPNASCRTDCKLPRCGDGVLDDQLGEECDDGANNSNDPNAACRTNCKLPRCGDGVTDTSLGEECDDGANNSNNPNAACRTDCKLPRCGDGIVDDQHGEECDGANLAGHTCEEFGYTGGTLVCGNGCTLRFTQCEGVLSTCGDGTVDAGEECDDGAANSDNTPNACRTNCRLPSCGDGILDSQYGEECDDGTSNSSDPNAACRTDCRLPRCGDGIVDDATGEACDDGNGVDWDGCTSCSISEFQVNTTTEGFQERPSIAMDSNGRVLVVWSTGNTAYARVYGSDGTPDSSELAIWTLEQANSADYPKAAMASDGHFAVAWGVRNSTSHAVYVRLYSADGSPLGNEIPVKLNIQSHDLLVEMAMAPDGRFVVIWQEHDINNEYTVFARLFMPDGSPDGPEYQVIAPGNDPYNPAVAIDSSGNFTIVWRIENHGVFGQRFMSDGSPDGPEFQVSTSGQSHDALDIAMIPNGRFVIVWHAFVEVPHSGYCWGIMARIYDSNGNPVGDELKVDDFYELEEWNPAVSMAPDGRFVVVWQGLDQDGNGFGILARRLDSDGSFMSNQFLINLYTHSDQVNPDVVVGADGRFATAWESLEQDGNGYGIYAQRSTPDGTPLGTLPW